MRLDTRLDRGTGDGDILFCSPPHAPGLCERRQTVVRTIDVPRSEVRRVRLLTPPRPSAIGRGGALILGVGSGRARDVARMLVDACARRRGDVSVR